MMNKKKKASQAASEASGGMPELHYQGNAILRMLSYARPYTLHLALCFLLVLVITGLELLKPIIIGGAIDQFITGSYGPGEMVRERFGGILKASALYLAVLLGLFICNRVQYLVLQTTGQKIIYEIRNQLFTHVESLSMRFFDLTPVGKIVTRITNDVETINQLYSNILVKLFKNTMKILGLTVIMTALDPQMALYSFVMVPFVLFLTVLFKNISRKAYQLTRTRLTALNTFLSENITGMKVIQIFNREAAKFKEFEEKSQLLYQSGYREMMVFAIFRPSLYLVSIIASVIVIAGGSYGVLQGTLSIGTLYVFMRYINSFFEPIQELAEQFSTLQSAVASAEKIFTLLDVKPLLSDPKEPVKPEAITRS